MMKTLDSKFTRLALLVMLFMQSCSGGSDKGGDGLRHIRAISDTKMVSSLDQYILESEIIPIAEDEVLFSGITKMLVADHYFVLSGGVVYRVSKTGDDVRRVGNVGRGPGEYLSIKDIAINLNGDELWCMDALNSIIRYDLQTLEYIGKVDIVSGSAYARAMIPQQDNHVSLYYPNPEDEDLTNDEVQFYCLKEYDLNGNLVGEDMKWTGFNVMAAFSVPVSFSGNGRCVLSPESSVPAILFENGEATEQIFFDFGKQNIPDDYFSRAGGDPWMAMADLFAADYFKLVSSVFMIEDDIYFRAFGAESSSWNFYMKDGGRGIRWQSIGTSSPPIFPIAVEDGYLIFQLEDYGLHTQDEEPDPLKKYIIQKHGIPSEPAMTYLLKVKFNV